MVANKVKFNMIYAQGAAGDFVALYKDM